jgi:hypothetical protein
MSSKSNSAVATMGIDIGTCRPSCRSGSAGGWRGGSTDGTSGNGPRYSRMFGAATAEPVSESHEARGSPNTSSAKRLPPVRSAGRSALRGPGGLSKGFLGACRWLNRWAKGCLRPLSPSADTQGYSPSAAMGRRPLLSAPECRFQWSLDRDRLL